MDGAATAAFLRARASYALGAAHAYPEDMTTYHYHNDRTFLQACVDAAAAKASREGGDTAGTLG